MDYDKMSDSDLMERCRAARCLVETIPNADKAREMEVAAFMAIFHPDHPTVTGEKPPMRVGRELRG